MCVWHRIRDAENVSITVVIMDNFVYKIFCGITTFNFTSYIQMAKMVNGSCTFNRLVDKLREINFVLNSRTIAILYGFLYGIRAAHKGLSYFLNEMCIVLQFYDLFACL